LEQTLWDAADKMRGNLKAAEYKHVVLGLVFLKRCVRAAPTVPRRCDGRP
jgi:type I restriction-modification system DNA methylase subunit